MLVGGWNERERERERRRRTVEREGARKRAGMKILRTGTWLAVIYIWHATSCNALRWFMLPVTRLGAQWLIIILTLMHIRFTCYLIHPLEQHISFPCYAVIGASFV
ncbi:unnamed protein product [Prunus armeniaca]